jgi:hypothetical protein
MRESSAYPKAAHAHFINQILKPHIRTRHTIDFQFVEGYRVTG